MKGAVQMAKTLDFPTKVFNEMSLRDLLNYKNNLIEKIFEIGTPLNEEETELLEFLSAQCDLLDTFLELTSSSKSL